MGKFANQLLLKPELAVLILVLVDLGGKEKAILNINYINLKVLILVLVDLGGKVMTSRDLRLYAES